jgi:hypothetical protein
MDRLDTAVKWSYNLSAAALVAQAFGPASHRRCSPEGLRYDLEGSPEGLRYGEHVS